MNARVVALSLILQVLVDELRATGSLDAAALARMKGLTLAVAGDMQDSSATAHQVGGARVQEELASWFAALE